jgi:prolyl oligopeptidase
VRNIMKAPPQTDVAPVTEVLHGVPVVDPYRWLEDQNSSETRLWLREQADYARSYLDGIPCRERVQERVRELLAVECYDSLLISRDRYVFRKRSRDQEQPCIYFRDGAQGDDQLLLDPATLGGGKYLSAKPLTVSWDGRLLLYELKCGGERSGRFELLDIATRRLLPDKLPHGYLRGFAFSSDSTCFYYVHEAVGGPGSDGRLLRFHLLGSSFEDDLEIFRASAEENVRLHLIPSKLRLGLVVRRFREKTFIDFYIFNFGTGIVPEVWLQDVDCKLIPFLLDTGRILAVTDRDAPNFQIVELIRSDGGAVSFAAVIPEEDRQIKGWAVTQNSICVSYQRETKSDIDVFDLTGKWLHRIPTEEDETVRLIASTCDRDELFLERESFVRPIQIHRYNVKEPEATNIWAKREFPFDSTEFRHIQVWFTAKDGVQIPMFLAGKREVLECGPHPTIMTSYGGYGVSMTPQFSVFACLLMERGCLFALPNIRGGSEFGVDWHIAAKGRKRQVAFDDFLGAAEWLITSDRTDPKRLAIFGGSNSGLLVGAAMTQRPDLFRAVLCMVPLLDMLRFHLFDSAQVWSEEFGTAADPGDFEALAAYSPYHRVRENTAYPATMIVSGDADQNCNPMHARKMMARLQAANTSGYPIILDYREFRGHSPVLPLSERIAGLSDRLAFFCDQLAIC